MLACAHQMNCTRKQQKKETVAIKLPGSYHVLLYRTFPTPNVHSTNMSAELDTECASPITTSINRNGVGMPPNVATHP